METHQRNTGGKEAFNSQDVRENGVEILKKGYFYLYYVILKVWSKEKNPVFSKNFQADICLIFLKGCFSFSLFNYIQIGFDIKFNLSPFAPMGFLVFILIVGSTIYIFNFSSKYKFYIKEFENWSKKKNLIGSSIVWLTILIIFLNLIFSVELLKRFN